MGLISFLSAVFLVFSCQVQGTSTGTPVFVQTGKDLILNVTKPVTLEEGSDVTWRFNGSNNIIKLSFHDNTPTIFKNYKGRADFSVQNHSLLLKNVHKNESGDYTATVSGETVQPVAEYKVTVQDPVSPVKLTVDPVSNSSESCNLTVTCSTNDSHISSTFRCDTQTCSQEGRERSNVTTSAASLHVYLLNDLIICNHSNQVSCTKDIKMIEHFCPRHAGPENQGNNVIVPVLVVIFIIIVIVVVVFIYFVCFRKEKGTYERENIENTVYATPQVKTTAQHVNQSPTDDASGLSPTSTYCLVGQHTGPVGSTETRGKTLPESLYAQIEKPARS